MKPAKSEKQFEELIDAMTSIAALDFSQKLTINPDGDALNPLRQSINMLSENLKFSLASTDHIVSSDQRYKLLFSKSSDAIVLVKNYYIIDCNEKATEVFGYSRDEMIGQALKILTPKYQKDGTNTRDIISEISQKAAQNDENYFFHFQNQRKDGSVFDAEINIGAFKINGELYFQNIVRDVSAQKKMNDALKRSVAEFKGIFDHAPNAMLITRNNHFIECNPAFCDLFGYSTEELSDLHFSILSHPEDTKLHLPLEEALIAGEIPRYSLDKRYICKNGSVIYCNVNVSLVNGGDDIEDYFITQFIDRSKQYKAESLVRAHLANLKKINAELDQFAYVVSHDLKAPLRGISALANFIEEDLEEQNFTSINNNLRLIKKRIHRMGMLITGILALSKIGRTNEALNHFNVKTLIEDILDLLAPQKPICLDLPKQLPTIYCAKLSLQQIFQNLLSNAIKYNDKNNCHITIDCIEKKRFYKFSISDNGPGIPLEYHDKVFKIFQTLHSRDEIESTGVGLSIVRKWVDSLGGKIWIDSTYNGGTKFIFTIKKINSNKTTLQG